jgi:hypothetical protein
MEADNFLPTAAQPAGGERNVDSSGVVANQKKQLAFNTAFRVRDQTTTLGQSPKGKLYE